MPLFNSDDAAALRPWLVKNLEPICDAEPDVLSNYVLALLKHDAPEPELKETFTKQLYDFLDNETSKFVDELFAAIKSKSYKNSTSKSSTAAPAPAPATQSTSASATSNSAPFASVSNSTPSTSKDGGIPIPIDALLSSKSDPRGTKRRLDSESGPGDQQERSPPKGPRLRESGASRYEPYARHENGGRGYRDDRDRGRDWERDRNGVRPPTGPAADRDGRRGDERDTKRQLCRDYHERGFCARGSQCMFSHGEEAVTPMGFPPMMGMMGPNFMMPWMMNQLGAGGYDPSQSLMDMSTPRPPNGNMDVVMNDAAPKGNLTEAKVMTASNDMPQTNGANVARNQSMRGGHGAYGRNMRGRATPAGSWHGETDGIDGQQDPGSSSEPRRDKTLVVEKIPSERLSLEEINNWFKRFGTVTNVAIDVPSAKALVSFATHDEARDAWRSEDAVFGNRFVKLYWHRPMGNHGQAGAKLLAASAPIINNLSAPPKADPAPVKSGPPQPAVIDPSQQKFERLMAEQKVLMVKLTSAKPDEKQSIKTRLRELITELQEVSAVMRNGSATTSAPSSKPASNQSSTATPAQTNGATSKKEQLDNDLEMMSAESQDAKEAETQPVNSELQAKLKKLREEAASLGLNTEAAPSYSTPAYRPYGSRGRGAWRGRGRGAPPRASMKLDNRPRTLVVKGLPDTDEAKQSAKSWFASFPECDTVAVNETTGELEVKYKTRFAADQALASGATIPALGTLQFAWPTSTPGAGTVTAAPAKKSPTAEPSTLDTDVGMRAESGADEDGWGASGGWDDEDEGGGRRDRM